MTTDKWQTSLKTHSNGRNIGSISSRRVFPLWKLLLTNELQKSNSPIDVDVKLIQKVEKFMSMNKNGAVAVEAGILDSTVNADCDVV